MFESVIINHFSKIKLLGELCGKVKNNNEQQELDRIYCY